MFEVILVKVHLAEAKKMNVWYYPIRKINGILLF